MTVVTDGMERVICEDCGDVTIRFESTSSRDLARSKFSRVSDSMEGHRRSEAVLGLGVLTRDFWTASELATWKRFLWITAIKMPVTLALTPAIKWDNLWRYLLEKI
jgi:hypothetical protein